MLCCYAGGRWWRFGNNEKRRRIPIDDKIPPTETFVESESATNFKGFEALYNNVLDIDDQLLCSDVQMEVGCVRWNATIIWDVSMKR